MICTVRFSVAAGLLLSAVLVTGCTSNRDREPNTAEVAVDRDAEIHLDLQTRMRGVLDHTFHQRVLSSREQAAWQVVHGILAFGPDFPIEHDKKIVPALDWLLQGGNLNGWVMRPGDHGVVAVIEPGTKTGQGHPDQWLGYLSQCGLGIDEPLVVEGKTYKVRDLVSQAQWDIHDGMEATWTLMALSTYLPLEARWTSKDGSEWTIERIVDMEARQSLADSACGGSHRLYGLTVAVNRYLQHHDKKPADLTGGWKLAEEKITLAKKMAREFQQSNGAFSTAWFERPGTSSDIAIQINRTGHTLEFLTVALTDEELKQPWVAQAAEHLCLLLEETQDMALECGSLYHAAHGLLLYHERLYGPLELEGKATVDAGVAPSAPVSDTSLHESPSGS